MSQAKQTPRLGVSACIWRDGKVLLVLRGKETWRGKWSLPGGAVEFGETVREAAQRELREETGIEAELERLVDIDDAIRRNPEGLPLLHYAIACFTGRWKSGEAQAKDDAVAVRWVALTELDGLDMTPRTPDYIRAAWHLLNN